ncbi:MAG TPA: copper chaperone PCu(A)C [Hellea balneolensis]|uniref:Copper chaperone PCu(A)C n=1 Tax=Hellea balneolensis TaxID=287478 RepID=A0A7V5U1H2_9PROT|nr:copper chaperone PCu(A)C [Hellea balneolensis]
MIKKVLIYPTLLLLLLVSVATVYVFSGDKRLRDANIHVENAVIQAPLPGKTMAVAYFDLVNEGGADELLSVRTPVAKRAELHISTNENGISKMRRLDSVKVMPLATTRFARGGRHVMLFDVNIPENATTAPLILTFARPPLPPAPDAKKDDKKIYFLKVDARIVR